MAVASANQTHSIGSALRRRLGLLRLLYVQVLVAVVIGAVVGVLDPALGVALQPLGTAFIRAIRAVVTPLIFTTVVVGIAGIGDMRKLGRIGVTSLIYFELVSTLALCAASARSQPGPQKEDAVSEALIRQRLQDWAKACWSVREAAASPSKLWKVWPPTVMLGGQLARLEGLRPCSSRSAVVTTLKVDPGGYWPVSARLMAWSLGWVTAARTLPVEAWIATSAAG